MTTFPNSVVINFSYIYLNIDTVMKKNMYLCKSEESASEEICLFELKKSEFSCSSIAIPSFSIKIPPPPEKLNNYHFFHTWEGRIFTPNFCNLEFIVCRASQNPFSDWEWGQSYIQKTEQGNV